MRILVAPDKFKGSLGAAEVADHIAAGLRDVLPSAEITLLPVADGGEGTASLICAAQNGEWRECEAHDPLGRMVTARYCTIANGETAVIEMSQASGLWRLRPDEYDPLKADSFGTGEMIRDARRRGVKEIIIGLGGSATNDGGFGMARALGFRFLDQDGTDLQSLSELPRLDRIESGKLNLTSITAAADVRNPLLGPRGATRAFATQKGASPEQIELLEAALMQLAEVVARDLGADHRHTSGAGAAGGLGFGLASFCGAQLRSGFDVVAEATGLEKAIRQADVIITGEGRLDAQTLEGKAPAGVARMAGEHRKKVYAIAGAVEEESAAQKLFTHVFALSREGIGVEVAIRRAPELVRARARELAGALL